VLGQTAAEALCAAALDLAAAGPDTLLAATRATAAPAAA
jgi:hypothetical protein